VNVDAKELIVVKVVPLVVEHKPADAAHSA
jgi:hypothetical protein